MEPFRIGSRYRAFYLSIVKSLVLRAWKVMEEITTQVKPHGGEANGGKREQEGGNPSN